ncbi:TPA: hypothetical protein KNH77_003220 [Clostridioides difficile]|uniref:Uncharacterized protein n=2 Tax=root TaxID=1 RepID=A0A3G1E3C4_9CAUD|nr:hypothetical protein [Clostridioides difficile]YP_009830853.1 hypothetical protein HWA97_gp57 [Clostridium phage CDKM9]ANT45125.1 hypothetical protein CDHM9_57 [Clostridium phage CDKM9]EGT4830120.1 hypothetical protein [Clostridioides difficile]EGT4933102.1 hypothetical protein [Clostridioides difficile]ELX4514061.1 hypothetical protein [Clostridioides difficile]MBY1875324.1 hypothetical protein [Clostridioides difficile]
MKTKNEIIKDLEDRLFLLRFTTVDEVDWDVKFGQISALESCIDKHRKGWTLEQFKEHLEKHKSENMYGDYIDGFMSVLRRNIKDMEGLENE